jgi:hypothetical protein
LSAISEEEKKDDTRKKDTKSDLLGYSAKLERPSRSKGPLDEIERHKTGHLLRTATQLNTIEEDLHETQTSHSQQIAESQNSLKSRTNMGSARESMGLMMGEVSSFGKGELMEMPREIEESVVEVEDMEYAEDKFE